MAIESKVRIWYVGTAETIDANGITNPDQIVLAAAEGDLRTTFPAGRKFTIMDPITPANNGIWTVESVAFGGGKTTITTVEATLTTSATIGTSFVYPSEWIDLTIGAQAVPQYNKPGERIVDRLGLVHRIVPPTATNAKRFVTTLMLSFPVEDLDIVSDGPVTGDPLFDFFYDKCVDADSQFVIFASNTGEDQDSNSYTTNYAYRCRLEDIPEFLYGSRSLVEGEYPNFITMEFLVDYDGTTADYDVPHQASGGITYRSRPA